MASFCLGLVTLHAPCTGHGGPCRLGVQVLDACPLRRCKASDLATGHFIINILRCSLIIPLKSSTTRFRHSLIEFTCWGYPSLGFCSQQLRSVHGRCSSVVIRKICIEPFPILLNKSGHDLEDTTGAALCRSLSFTGPAWA